MLLRLYVVLQRALDQRFSPREHETYLDYPVWAIFTRPFFENSSGTTSRYTSRTSHAASATQAHWARPFRSLRCCIPITLGPASHSYDSSFDRSPTDPSGYRLSTIQDTADRRTDLGRNTFAKLLEEFTFDVEIIFEPAISTVQVA